MKNFFKKSILVSVLSFVGSVKLLAASATLAIATTTFTNIPTILPQQAKITSIILSSPANGSATVTLYDTYTNSLTYSNIAYSVISSYATNYVTTYTNYYGATNSITNFALVDITNTVAAVTNTLSPLLILASPTNVTTTFAPLSATFNRGIWVTNTSATTSTLTITYVQ